ncbi:MAG: GGDEF domain-containing protein [Clostridia bacterium]|nr:GGDEF domain-containing protein [Clostridia bacterium]NCC43267.1 GGDEF domain-containing protein [Clostridia bacterium]
MTNLPAVFIANGIAIVLLVVLLLSSNRNMRYGLLDNKIFYAMVAFTILQCFMESAAFFIDGKLIPGYRILSIILNCVLYITDLVFAFLWTVYADLKLFSDTGRLKKVYPFVAIPAVLVIIGCIVNLFTPVFFSVSDANIYQRTGLYIIPYIVTYLYLAYGAILVYSYRNKVKRYFFLPAIIFMIPIIIGSLIQYFVYGLSLVWAGVAIALVSLYINVQNEASCIDALSGLFSRQYLNRYLYSESRKNGTGKALAGIMLDIDEFKKINDKFGHQVGDEAITAAGHILRNSVCAGDLVTRYAGDEFVIVMRVEDEKDIQDTIQQIIKNTESFNASGKSLYKLQFSMGYSIYGPHGDTVDAFLKRMDEAMYKDKKEKREKNILPERRNR